MDEEAMLYAGGAGDIMLYADGSNMLYVPAGIRWIDQPTPPGTWADQAAPSGTWTDQPGP